MAKPKQKFSRKEQRLILALFEMGKTDKEVSSVLKTPLTTFKDRCDYTEYINDEGKEVDSLSDVIKKVKGTADSKVEVSLYNQALIGKVAAIAIWLFNRQPETWKTVSHIKISEEASKIAQLTPEEVKELASAIKR